MHGANLRSRGVTDGAASVNAGIILLDDRSVFAYCSPSIVEIVLYPKKDRFE
jgi:hypothetical protein